MIPLLFPKNSCFDRFSEVCSIAVPQPQGRLIDPDQWSVTGPNGPVTTQNKVTSRWPDGSVRWIVSLFQADLPANRPCRDYALDHVSSPKMAVPASAAHAEDGSVIVSTGVLDLRLGAPKQPFFESVLLQNGAGFGPGEITGPSYQYKGNEYTAFVGENGWKITENGPVRVRVETSGKHQGTDGTGFDYDIAILAFAGKPYIQVEYRFIHREEAECMPVTAMKVSVRPNTEGKRWLYATSNYATEIIESDQEKLSHQIDAEYLRFVSNEQIPEIHFGTYFCDWRDDHRGVCTTFYQAYQNFPKGFDAGPSGYDAWIIPPQWGDLSVYQGMAKTNRFMLEFHDAQKETAELDVRSLYYQMPDKPVISSEVYTDAGQFTEFIGSKRNINAELYLRSMGERTGRTYGMLHWGDYPDAGYTNQGRAHGDYVWTNNEYDYPHQAMIEYARTGNRMYLDRMLVAAQHWMDVDVCHFSHDPLLMGGQHIHCRNHIEQGCKPSHEWVEGLWDYYHVTGDEFARETIMGIAENVRRVLVEEIFPLERYTAAREAGWALRTFCAMYTETGDEGWLEYGERIVDYFDQWKKDFGAWLMPYTTASMIRVPFMISVAVISLDLYYRIRPSQRVRDLIVDAVDDILEESSTYEGGFMYYKELPSLQRNNMTPLNLHSASVAYELTGDPKYITYYMDMFRYTILYAAGGGGGDGVKKPSHECLTVAGDSPKRFAQSYPCLASFYKHVMDLGLMPEGFLAPGPV